MRKTACLILTAAALASVPAQAQTYDPKYPVCMRRVVMGGGMYIDCSFTSLPQCEATASGLPATCVVNPYFPAERPHLHVYRRHRRVH